MPFRSQKLIELCAECKVEATTRCRRCQRPLCADHAPAKQRRCEPCEAFYSENLPTVSTAKHVALAAGTTLGLIPAVIFIWTMGFLGAGVGVGALGPWGLLGFPLGFGCASYLVKKLHERTLTPERALERATKRARRRFMRERKPVAKQLTE